jgi:hypothetical protein
MLSFSLIYGLFCTAISFVHHPDSLPDQLGIHTSSRSNDQALIFNLKSVPRFGKYENRYEILSNVNNNYSSVENNYAIQTFLASSGYNDSSLLNSFSRLQTGLINQELPLSITDNRAPLIEKQLFFGAWRNKIIRSATSEQIRESVTEGTNALLSLGYSDLAEDFLPFITMLMEENHLMNYDISRTRLGSNSKGIVTSTKILNAMAAMDASVEAGVCRDVHETGREILSTMFDVYFSNKYPTKQIDVDDYIFLQSWTTDASQHVTLSLMDPLDTKKVYELDWGRVIRKTDIPGYNNGRLYGNTFRIWQYSKSKQKTIPIDFKRTDFGFILDENILTDEEYTQFNGKGSDIFYSDLRYIRNISSNGRLSLSFGSYHPMQKYFLSGYRYDFTSKMKGHFLKHSGTIALQAAFNEDTERKALLYPEKDWRMTMSLMGIPRFISRFNLTDIKISEGLSFNAFFNQQLDIFLIINSFRTNESAKLTKSGDANLSFSNGINLTYQPEKRNYKSIFTFQARSSLLPNDIRLMSPDPGVVFSNLRFITPAIDVINTTIVKAGQRGEISVRSLFEFTNLNAVIFSGSVSGRLAISENRNLEASAGFDDQLKGLGYFWYPAENRKIDLRFNTSNKTVSLSVMKFPRSAASMNLSCILYLNR